MRKFPEGFHTLDSGRYVLPAACTLIAFYFASARQLTSEERLYAIKAAEPHLRKVRLTGLAGLLKEDWIVRDEFLTIDLAPFVRSTVERLDQLTAARNMVESSPDILSGTLVIRGTRVPVHDVAASVEAGHSTERILIGYPGLTVEQVELATLYAEANPARGRPRRAGELPKGAVIVSDRWVPRRRKAG